MIKIRTIQKEDLPNLLWDESRKNLKKYEDKNFQRFLNGEILWLVAVTDNGDLIGQAKVRLSGETEFFDLIVKPEERRKKIGSKLISQMEVILKKKGFHELFISVEVDNSKAQKLYEKLEYAVIESDFIEEREYANDKGELCPIELNLNLLKKIL